MDSMLYSRVDIAVQKTKWAVYIADTASLHIPGYYKKFPERGSIYTPQHTLSRAYLTIHEMILHYSDEADIRITDRDDLILITGILSDYIEMCNNYMPANLANGDEVAIYVDKAKKLLQALAPTAENMKTNRDYDSPVNPKTDTLDGLLDLIARGK